MRWPRRSNAASGTIIALGSSASAVSKGSLKPSDMCLVDFEGNQLLGTKKRTSEILMHLEIMKRQPRAVATAHCHPPHATAFAVANVEPPTCMIPEIEVFIGRLRRKLDPDNEYRPIETLRGRGYRLALPPARHAELKGLRLLVLDDHPMMREGLAQLIAHEADLAVCGEAGTSHEAIEAVDKSHPDLLLVDISLPDKSGLEVLEEVRVRDQETPIFLLTGLALSEDRPPRIPLPVPAAFFLLGTSSFLFVGLRGLLP